MRLQIVTLFLTGLLFGWFLVCRVPALLDLMRVPPQPARRPRYMAGLRFRRWRPRFRLWHLLVLMVPVALACFACELGRRWRCCEALADLHETRERAALTYLESKSFREYLEGKTDRPFADMGHVNEEDLEEYPLMTLERIRSPEAVIRSLQDQAERNRRLKEFYRRKLW